MRKNNPAAQVAFMGLLFALAIALSVLESWLPAFIAVPGIKLGLSNIVVMYCVFLLGASGAFTLAVLKALFVLFTRGLIAAALSGAGGAASICVMLLLISMQKHTASYSLISMAGAVAHNMGQLALAALLLGTGRIMLYYLPVLFFSGLIMGMLTAVLLRAVMPYFSKWAK